MAVSITSLTGISGADDTDASSYLTPSWTPLANTLYLVRISNYKASTPDIPTLTGNNLTWVQMDTIVYDNAGTQQRVTTFRAMGASPTTGETTISFGGNTQLGVAGIFEEVTGMDTSGTDGSGAIVQTKTVIDASGTATSITVTFDSPTTAGNAEWGAFALSGTSTFTVGSGFTQLDTTSNTTPASRGMTEWKATNDDTVDATISAAGPQIGGIAVEIKIPDAPGGTQIGRRSLLGVGI